MKDLAVFKSGDIITASPNAGSKWVGRALVGSEGKDAKDRIYIDFSTDSITDEDYFLLEDIKVASSEEIEALESGAIHLILRFGEWTPCTHCS